MSSLKSINVQQNYTIHLQFNDGVSGYFKFSSSFFKGPFHMPLYNVDFFSKVYKDDLNMIMWPNGFGVSSTEVYDWLIESGNDIVWIS